MITADRLKRWFPRIQDPAAWAAAFTAILPDYEIVSPMRLAAFLAQCGHESAGITVLVENLNYSSTALERVFPKYFPNGLAAQYARQPDRIANRVYADRMGNGPEESGDGWRFRGRGCIQITGRENYRRLAAALDKTIAETVPYLETIDGAVESACWYWRMRNLNPLADAGDMVALTRRINGGLHGLDARQHLYTQILHTLTRASEEIS